MLKTDVVEMLLKARKMHLEWRIQAENLIHGVDLGGVKVPIDHHCCEFGQWCYGPAKSCLNLLPHFKLMLETHQVMHAVFQQMHELAMQNNFKDAQDRLVELTQASDTLIEALDLLEQEVMAAPVCLD